MINKVILMGRLTEDPELKTTSQGISVTTFRIAVERDYVQKGSERQADFPTIVCWRSTAEFVSRYFHKGNMIAIEGQLQTRSYKDKNGSNHYLTEVYADKVSFTGEKVDVKQNNSQTNNSQQQNYQQPQSPQVPPQNNYQQPKPEQSYQQSQQQPMQNSAPDSENFDYQDMPLLNDDDLPF